MVHARLGIAEENSGKLVTLVKNQAKLLAEERGYDAACYGELSFSNKGKGDSGAKKIFF
ncbi:MAG: hypothetical protein ABIF11_10215 [Nitrospirota bacterium]